MTAAEVCTALSYGLSGHIKDKFAIRREVQRKCCTRWNQINRL